MEPAPGRLPPSSMPPRISASAWPSSRKRHWGQARDAAGARAALLAESQLARNRFNAYLANKAAREAPNDGQHGARAQQVVPMQGGRDILTEELSNYNSTALAIRPRSQSSCSFHSCTSSLQEDSRMEVSTELRDGNKHISTQRFSEYLSARNFAGRSRI
jgi:hypothetical protein